MNILAFDTTLDVCSAALARGAAQIVHRHEAMPRGQAERLPVMLGEILQESGLGYQDLDLIAVTIGPGTFTGTRIGLAAARALNIVSPLPVLGLTSLAVLAAAVPPEAAAGRPIWALIDARREEFYGQGFCLEHGRLKELGPPTRCFQDQVAALIGADSDCLLVGSGAAKALGMLVRGEQAQSAASPDARVMVKLARLFLDGGETMPDALPTPLYLRPPDAKLPRRAALV